MNATKIRYEDGKGKCPCGGEVMFDASFTQKLPVGLGFVGTKFQMDFVLVTGFSGECMECGKKIQAVEKTKHVTKFPASINRKLKGMVTA